MKHEIIFGEPAEELRALQLLSLTLADVAGRLSQESPKGCQAMVTPPLALAAARALTLSSCAGLETPLEVLALSTRNVFEIWLRLRHVMASQDNCQCWREENLTDQLQVYDAILKLDGPGHAKEVIREEVQRLAQFGSERGIQSGRKPLMAGDLANKIGEVEEYAAFYKLYSKLVHPSSWFVNSPSAVATPMYRQTLVINAQIYACRILRAIEGHFTVDIDDSYDSALNQLMGIQPC